MTQPTTPPERPAAPPPKPEEDEVLDVGQEEVFSRTEVELGRIEHATGPGHKPPSEDRDS